MAREKPAPQAPGHAVVPLLALVMFLAPALGVPHEEMIQDTLKSVIVSLGALAAALAFILTQRGRTEPLRWHGVIWLPLLLMAYALGSMAWSHTYLGGVEAVRWFIFALVLWLGLNSLTPERIPALAWGIHGGAFVASMWAAFQFWFDMQLFPQGPHPASTFVNRNFFAEFAACTIPFGALLLANARRSPMVALLAFSNAFVVVAILMTGTRAALLAMWLQVLVVLPAVAWKCRARFAFSGWPKPHRAIAAGVLLATVGVLGAIPTGDARIREEGKGTTALARGLNRTQSIGPSDHSLSIRKIMWRATMDMIRARPLSGVGAGAWENDIPLYQAQGSQLETDYYAHNEYLQLIAEYGLVGWAFLLALAAWLLRLAWRAWRASSDEERAEQPFQAVALTSLLALFIVSNVGFAWRMASTGALFALGLGLLAASQARLGLATRWEAAPLRWSPSIAKAAGAFAIACTVLALYITQRAAEAESKIVSATRMALTISHSGDYNNPQWAGLKREMLSRLREGIALNRHYRKITPMVGDELSKWGDWKNAIWIWESVLDSRPHVVAILGNVARGYASIGDMPKAMVYLERARRLQPRAPAVRSLEVILTSRAGDQRKAQQMAKVAIAEGIWDFDMLNAAFVLSWRVGDHEMALKAMDMRLAHFPEVRAMGYVQLGTFYATEIRDTPKALEAWRKGIQMATPREKFTMAAQIPTEYHQQLGLGAGVAQPPAQTSSSSR